MHEELNIVYVDRRPESAVELHTFQGFCGCGRRAAFSVRDGKLACNKYTRCSPRNTGADAAEKASIAINDIAQLINKEQGDEAYRIVGDIIKIIDGLS